jgi:hypothetical protein
MKIRVIRSEDHREELISIVGPVEISEGDHLSSLHSAEGLDHYFTQDGYYDGWGKDVSGSNIGLPEVEKQIESIERDRKVKP